MNTLEKNFNNFMNRRLNHVEAQLPVMHNTAAIALERTLNDKQLQLFVQAFKTIHRIEALSLKKQLTGKG